MTGTPLTGTSSPRWRPCRASNCGRGRRNSVLELVEYAYANSAFYRELWDEHGVHPRDIRSLEDFRARIPFITKDMVRAYRARTGDPFGGLLCVPVEELTSVSSSSGTTGDPEFFAEIWQDAPPLVTAQVRDLWELGLRPGDRVLSPPGTFRNLMDAGFQALGAVVIEVDTWIGNMPEVVEALRTYRPAYLQMMYPQMVELEHLAEKTDLREAFSSLKGASCAGQPLSRKMRERIRDDWGIDVYEYTSAADTGTAWECREHDGFHLWEDTVFAECVEVDEHGWHDVPESDLGELVATDLDNRAAPLIRYRSEDLVRLSRDTLRLRPYPRPHVGGRTARRRDGGPGALRGPAGRLAGGGGPAGDRRGGLPDRPGPARGRRTAAARRLRPRISPATSTPWPDG